MIGNPRAETETVDGSARRAAGVRVTITPISMHFHPITTRTPWCLWILWLIHPSDHPDPLQIHHGRGAQSGPREPAFTRNLAYYVVISQTDSRVTERPRIFVPWHGSGCRRWTVDASSVPGTASGLGRWATDPPATVGQPALSTSAVVVSRCVLRCAGTPNVLGGSWGWLDTLGCLYQDPTGPRTMVGFCRHGC